MRTYVRLTFDLAKNHAGRWLRRPPFARSNPRSERAPASNNYLAIAWHHLCRLFVRPLFVGLLFVGLLFVGLLITGCGPRIGGGETAAQLRQSPLVIDLPALYIDYDRSGHASIGSVPVDAIGDALTVDLSRLNLKTEQINTIMDANIQHLQVTNTPDRLLLLVNGQLLPALVWHTERATTAGEGQMLAAGLAQITPLLSTVVAMGGGVVLRFPISAGTVPIPLTMVESDSVALEAAQDEYLAIIGTPPHMVIDVFYQADGSWRVSDLDATAWRAVLPLPWDRLNLGAEQIQSLRAGGIEDLILQSNREGLFVQVNQQPLPHLSWAKGELNSMIVLAAEGGLFRQLLGDTPTAYSLAATLEHLLPMLQVTEIELRIHFAAESNATAEE